MLRGLVLMDTYTNHYELWAELWSRPHGKRRITWPGYRGIPGQEDSSPDLDSAWSGR